MKPAELLSLISTYKMYVSECLSWRHKVRSISWPPHYKPMGKYDNASRFCDDPGATDEWRSQGGQLRSNKVKIRFSPITREKLEIETGKWCQTTRLVKTLRKICILTYFGHNLTLTWPWPDLRSNFEIDPSRSKSTCFEPARQGEHDGAIIIFYISHIKKVINEEPSPRKTTFHLMTSGAKTVDLRSNRIEKRYWGIKRAIQCLFYSS